MIFMLTEYGVPVLQGMQLSHVITKIHHHLKALIPMQLVATMGSSSCPGVPVI